MFTMNLKNAVVLSILGLIPVSNVMAVDIDKSTITEELTPGTYGSVNRDFTYKASSPSDTFHLNQGGDFKIFNGGRLYLCDFQQNTLYGVRVTNADNGNTITNLTFGGDLELSVYNNNFSSNVDKTFGIWKYAGYNPSQGGDQPEDKGGTITLNNTTIKVQGKQNAYGLLAGNDFGNNSVGSGKIISNGNLQMEVTSTAAAKSGLDDDAVENTNRTFGAIAFSENSVIEINGKNNEITVTANESNGERNHETVGLFTSDGGQIKSSTDSLLKINVVGKTGQSRVYGISSGTYDNLEQYKDSQGKSGVNLQGRTEIRMGEAQNSYYSRNTAFHSSMKANDYAKDLKVYFKNMDKTGINIGLWTECEGNITVDSLYIGSEDGNDSKNPAYLTALETLGYSVNEEGVTKLFDNSGTINVNKNGNGNVQLFGRLLSDGKGTIDVHLTNSNSYLIGNTFVSEKYDKYRGINLEITNGARWENTQGLDSDGRLQDSSNITNLILSDNGFVDLTRTKFNDAEDFQNIYINENFSGNYGYLKMDIDASTNVNNSDRVYVDGTHSGTHYITLNNVGANTDGAEGTVLVSVNDEQGKFEANDSEGALYWNRYDLDSKESTTNGYNKDWYLKEVEQLDEPTTSVDTILGANALGYHTWRAETDKLMKRMGDLRHNGEDEKGAWFRVRGAEISRDGEASFENKYTVYELGYDEITKKTDRFTRYQGAALSYIDGTSSFARGSGENDGKSIAFYTTEMRNKGHYLDLVFRIADMDSDYKVYDTNGNKITGEPENVGVSLSAEYGRKKVMDDNGWYIEPQGQLTVGYFGGDNYRAKYADQYIDVHQSGIPSVLGRIGFNIGRDIDENTNIYLKANLLHEFCGDYDVDMVDSAGNRRTESDTFNDTWFEYGIGAAIKTGKNNHIYFDFEKTAGGDFEKDWAWNAGMRWTF